MVKHLLSIDDLSEEQITSLFHNAKDPHSYPRTQDSSGRHHTPILATLFFEPSTRTRLSFEAAILRLGGAFISASDMATMSCAKGESLEDTIRVVSGYADIIAVRHPEAGAIHDVARQSEVPVVNAGDGSGEHPTQALCDLYALWSHHGEDLRGVRVVIFGDVRFSRAAHSFAQGLKIMGAESIDIHWNHEGVNRLDDIVDAVYITRPQLERHGNMHLNTTLYNQQAHDLVYHENAKDALIMHPLPRTGEISKKLDNDPRSIYFEQAKAGVPIRMSVLSLLLCEFLNERV